VNNDLEKHNEMYIDAIKSLPIDKIVDKLKVISPHCITKSIDDFHFHFEDEGEEYFEVIKYVLLDRKYSNYKWISDYFELGLFDEINKSEILEFIVNNHFESELYNSIKFSVLADDNHFDLAILLNFFDKIDRKNVNERDEDGYTMVQIILTKDYSNSSEMLERFIDNGYDMKIPFIEVVNYERNHKFGTRNTEHTMLEFYLNLMSFYCISDDNSKKLLYLLINNSTLNKDIIDNYIKKFSLNNFNFLEYINSIYENHPNCPTFFAENYLDEISSTPYDNLLPKDAKDIFVF
jgi:hypothetical protein